MAATRGGVGCLNVGHSNPRVVAAAREQLGRELQEALGVWEHALECVLTGA